MSGMKLGLIYAYTFPDGRVYIGSTTAFRQRIYLHEANFRKVGVGEMPVHRVSRQLGCRPELTVIEYDIPEVFLHGREAHWIHNTPGSINCALPSANPVPYPFSCPDDPKGYAEALLHPPKDLAAMRRRLDAVRHLGQTAEARAKRARAALGRKPSPETREKMRVAKIGSKHSVERRLAHSEKLRNPIPEFADHHGELLKVIPKNFSRVETHWKSCCLRLFRRQRFDKRISESLLTP